MTSRLTRRDFLRSTGGAMAASLALAGCGRQDGESQPDAAAAAAAPGGLLPVGVQLYCVREQMAEDTPGTLAQVAALGFQGVEFADYFGYEAAALRQMLDDNGLRACGTHIYLADMLGDQLAATVDFNRTLGNDYLIVRWLNEDQRDTKEALLRTCDQLNEVATNLAPHGMRVGYHNHDYSFNTFDGELAWNIMVDNTSPEVVFQLDTGNAAATGVDVIELLRRNEGRSATVHVKPYAPQDEQAYIGDDALDWPQIIEICRGAAGTEWFIVEYEVEGIPPLEALAANLEGFNALRA